MARATIRAALCLLLLTAPTWAQSATPPAQAQQSAFAEIETLLVKIRQTQPSARSRLLDQLYKQCGAFLDAHLKTATPEQLSLAGTTWLQLADRAGDHDALAARLKSFERSKKLPPDLVRLVRLHRARLSVKVGSPAPPWSRERIDSEGGLSLKNLRGKLVLLAFWASKNPNATAFMERKLKPLHARFGSEAKRPFALVGIGVSSRGETAAAQAAHAKETAITWPLVFDASGDCATDYGASDVPFLCLVDTDGKVLALGPGWQTIAKVGEILTRRLDPPKDD